ncbi:MAG: hypothetical protein DI538_04485 [Azospira oryzae]|jgi:hypothetical protein|nr:MAG: hypothetical protein DI538_04485 [Azospira oryzae]
MKTKLRSSILLLLAAVFTAGMIASCSDDGDKTPPADKTVLKASITEATTLLSVSVEGTIEGQYQTGSKAILQTAVTASQAVVDDASATQTAVDNTNVALQAAIATFKTKVVAAIAPENLLAYWKFDEGTGTVANDASANKLNGTLTVGHASLGGPVPSWSADRKGVANKALHFTKGGHIEVPSNAKFGPTELSISVWIKMDSLGTADCTKFGDRCNKGTFKDNYILAQNSYNGYKFQTQDDRYPFLTVKKSTSPDAYIDQAANTNIPLKQWHHIAVTFKNGEMKFYIDGVDASKNETITGTFITLTERYDFVIGAELPNAKVDPNISWVLPHFEGSMDELRMYNKVLTASQIQGIYNQEK